MTTDNRVFSALRSVFRYHKMVSKQVPEILLEMENTILKNRFKELSPEEIYQVVTGWPDFYKEQLVEDELQDEAVAQDLDNYLGKLN